MVTRSQKIRLGIFISIALFALIATLVIIIAPKFLEIRDPYFIGYRDISVTGLQEGGAVKYHGITVGYVSDISIDPKDIGRVIVEISLDHGTPIKTDCYADVDILGITGLKLIEIRGGSNEAVSLKPGDFILPGKSTTEMITGKAEVIAEKAEIALNNIAALTTEENRKKIISLIENSASTMYELNRFLLNNKKSLSAALANTEQLTGEIQELVDMTGQTMFHINTIARSDTLRQVIANLAEITETLKKAELIRLVQELNVAIENTNNVLREIDVTLIKSRSNFSASMESMRESADYLNQFSRMITEDPSILIRGTKPKDIPDQKLGK